MGDGDSQFPKSLYDYIHAEPSRVDLAVACPPTSVQILSERREAGFQEEVGDVVLDVVMARVVKAGAGARERMKPVYVHNFSAEGLLAATARSIS